MLWLTKQLENLDYWKGIEMCHFLLSNKTRKMNFAILPVKLMHWEKVPLEDLRFLKEIRICRTQPSKKISKKMDKKVRFVYYL